MLRPGTITDPSQFIVRLCALNILNATSYANSIVRPASLHPFHSQSSPAGATHDPLPPPRAHRETSAPYNVQCSKPPQSLEISHSKTDLNVLYSHIFNANTEYPHRIFTEHAGQGLPGEPHVHRLLRRLLGPLPSGASPPCAAGHGTAVTESLRRRDWSRRRRDCAAVALRARSAAVADSRLRHGAGHGAAMTMSGYSVARWRCDSDLYDSDLFPGGL